MCEEGLRERERERERERTASRVEEREDGRNVSTVAHSRLGPGYRVRRQVHLPRISITCESHDPHTTPKFRSCDTTFQVTWLSHDS